MKKLCVVGIYSVVHAVVDMGCAMLVAGLVTPYVSSALELMIALVLYNMFAFAFQLPFGILADKLNKNAIVSAIGCMCVALAYVASPVGIVACVVAGIGNALFHVGGGIDVLNIADKKASLPGIYVSTGALGLYIGSKSQYLGFTNYYVMVIILIVSAVALLWLYRMAKQSFHIENEEPDLSEVLGVKDKRRIIMYCLLVTICLRSYMGLILNFEWKNNFYTGLICVLAVVLGKMLGGIIGDRLGWRNVSTFSLTLSAILLVFAFEHSICGILGLLFFNMTMPITLTALSNMYNRNKGMAFGLTTLALFIGAVPVLVGYYDVGFSEIGVFFMTAVSIVALYVGLKMYEKVER